MSAELTNRLRRAVSRLEERRDSLPQRHPDRDRLNGKIEGVKLAASYLEDEERIFWTEASHPETVKTVAELDALPVGSVVLDPFAAVCTRVTTGMEPFDWRRVTTAVKGGEHRHAPYLPATVLHRGDGR